MKVIGKFHRRLKLLFGILVVVSLVYQFAPNLNSIKSFWRDLKSFVFEDGGDVDGGPWRWMDSDFRDDFDVNKTEIIILRWTAYFRAHYDSEVWRSKNCPYLRPSAGPGAVFDIPCRLTFDRRYLTGSDALLFHSRDLEREKVPENRPKDQVWIYLQQESPTHSFPPDLRAYRNVFNWTMTYRRDSDVYHPYGYVVPVVGGVNSTSTSDSNSSSFTSSTPPDPNVTNRKLANRPNLVAWLVSRCKTNSKREAFATELQKYIPVGIYGKCGKSCPLGGGDCRAYLAQTYKFHLSWENSLCSEYITEKFFRALENDLVPVVYGGQHPTDYSAIAPEGSYIDARSFKTTKELADYLLYLDQNDEEYLKYFEWKSKYKVIEGQGWCNLCQRVFEHIKQGAPGPGSSSSPSSPSVSPERKRKTTYYKNKHEKWYEDLFTWWHFLGGNEEPSAGTPVSEFHYNYNRTSACSVIKKTP